MELEKNGVHPATNEHGLSQIIFMKNTKGDSLLELKVRQVGSRGVCSSRHSSQSDGGTPPGKRLLPLSSKPRQSLP